MPTLSSNLVKSEIASVQEVEEALARQALYGGDLATNLLELATVSEERLTRALAESTELEAAPSGELPRAPESVRRLVPRDIASRYALYPLEENEGKLIVAVSEPLPTEVTNDLEFSLGLPLVQRITTLVRVRQAISRDYGLKLDRRNLRLLARLEGRPDPYPTEPPFRTHEHPQESPEAPDRAPPERAAPERSAPERPLLDSAEAPLRAPPTPNTAPSGDSALRTQATLNTATTEATGSAPTLDSAPRGEPAPTGESARAAEPAPTLAHSSHASDEGASVTPEPSPRNEAAREPVRASAPEPTPEREPEPLGALAEAAPAPPDDSALHVDEARAAPLDEPSAPAPVATDVATRDRPSPSPTGAVDLASLARAARRARQGRRFGPYTPAMAENDLNESENFEEVMSAFFAFAAQYFDYSVLFAVRGDLAEGRDAHGSGAPRAKVRGIGVPLDLPSTLADVIAHEPYRLARLSASGLDGALAKDLQRRPGPAVLILPVRVKSRAVLALYGDHGDMDVELATVGNVIGFASLVSAALERVIRRRKDPTRGALPRLTAVGRNAPAARADLPSREERASALASVLRSSVSEPPARRATTGRSEASSPPVARPVISVGPPRGPAAPTIARSSAPPPGLNSERPPRAASFVPLPSTSRTPIPSSFAPGAPPQSARSSAPAPEGQAAATTSASPPAHAAQGSPPPPVPASATGARSNPSVPATTRATEGSPPLAATAPAPELPSHSASTAELGEEAAPATPQSALAPAASANDGAERRREDPELMAELFPSHDSIPADEADDSGPVQLTPLAPLSRSLAHSARPLPHPGHSEELRLPTVIVDLAQDTEDLVARLVEGDNAAATRLIEIGAAAVPALVGAFPGPITSELRRSATDGPPRASECGPLMRVLARIGPKAAGVLSVRSADKDPAVRAWATRLLGEMPCMDAARAVARRFVDEDPDVRRAALAAGRMLQPHPNAGSVLAATLSEMLLDSSRRDRLQHMVIEAIADLREARAIPALATLLAAGSPEIQRSAHWALIVLARTDYGDDALAWDEWWRVNSGRHRIEWLIDALMHESQEIRRAAGDELKSLTKEYFGYYDDLPERERERAQKRYRDWWETKGKARFT